MRYKFRWPMYRTVFDEKKSFEISDEVQAKLEVMMNEKKCAEAEEAAKNMFDATNTPPPLSQDELKAFKEVMEGAIGHMLRKEYECVPDVILLASMKPLVIKELMRNGLSPFMAEDAVKKRNSEAVCALHNVLKETVPSPLCFLQKRAPHSFTFLSSSLKALSLRLEDVESQLEGTFFGEDSKNRPIDLLAEDVADLKTKMGHVNEALGILIGVQGPVKEETAGKPTFFVDRLVVGEAFKAVIGVLESGVEVEEAKESLDIVEPYIQHALKICPDLEIHDPLTGARFLYGLCTQPMTVLDAIANKTYFLDIDINEACTIASEVFGHKFLGMSKMGSVSGKAVHRTL